MLTRIRSAASAPAPAPAFILIMLGAVAVAQEDAGDASLNGMRELARQTDVLLIRDDDSAAVAELIDQPVFRYSDEARSIHDSTLWVWTDGQRPVALQKIEDSHDQGNNQRRWTYCFTSLSTGTVRAQWPDERNYESRQPGLAFLALSEAPQPAGSARARSSQFRQMARRFAATMINNPKTDDKLEMRLLPRPILEFSTANGGLPQGALFGFAAYGTNPDLLLVLELRPDESGTLVWQYAAARMTTGGLILRHDDQPDWSADWVHPTPRPFDNWTFFYVPRSAE